MKESGIYCIINKINNKKYIGQTVDLDRRIYDHKRLLKKNEHKNIYLQREFNKYGEENFIIEVIEKCDIKKLDDRECYWISKYKTMNNDEGFNMEGGGNKNKIISEASRQKKVGINNPMYGKKISNEHIEILRNRNRGKHSIINDEIAFNIKKDLSKGLKRKEVASKYNVNVHLIDKIIALKNWSYVNSNVNEIINEKNKREKQQRNSEIKRLNKIGYSYLKISKELNIDVTTVSNLLGNKRRISEDKKKKAFKLLSEGISTKEVAIEINVDYTTVLRWIKQSS